MLPIVNQQTSKGNFINIVYAGDKLNKTIVADLESEFDHISKLSLNHLVDFLQQQSFLTLPEVILIEADAKGECYNYIEKIRKNRLWSNLIIVVLSEYADEEHRLKALNLRVHDYYLYPFPSLHLIERLDFLIKFRLARPVLEDLQDVDLAYKIPLGKRAFDLVLSLALILPLSPLLLIVALIIKMDSKGPIIYTSKRVGTGYRVFDFYKFRSMRIDAEKELDNLSSQNQYKQARNAGELSVFVKIKDDPRITRFGNFIRNTSIDELPQLFNVLKGDMSLVGNRPLPLYEAELLTSNEWSMRFLAPAGVTGLWQISKRGAKVVSATERKKLDNFYAQKYSFWLDLRILFRTIPALFQKEKV